MCATYLLWIENPKLEKTLVVCCILISLIWSKAKGLLTLTDCKVERAHSGQIADTQRTSCTRALFSLPVYQILSNKLHTYNFRDGTLIHAMIIMYCCLDNQDSGGICVAPRRSVGVCACAGGSPTHGWQPSRWPSYCCSYAEYDIPQRYGVCSKQEISCTIILN